MGVTRLLETAMADLTLEPGNIDLLPGAGSRETALPNVRTNATETIRKARLRADLSDLADLVLLIAVNFLFLRWEASHVPFLSRDLTLLILLAVNGSYIISWALTRVAPVMKARRVSSTWSREERKKVRI